jgi:hypothetical protein
MYVGCVYDVCACMYIGCVYVGVCVCARVQGQRSKLFVAQHFMPHQMYQELNKSCPEHKLYRNGAIRQPLLAAWWRVYRVASTGPMVRDTDMYCVYMILLFDEPTTQEQIKVRLHVCHGLTVCACVHCTCG